MGLVDPFSAASKPMPDWESIPSDPLQFAATLRELDINAPHTPRLPRPRRTDREELPKVFPSPPYSHARHGSPSRSRLSIGGDMPLTPTRSPPKGKIGSDEWMETQVATCVDTANGNLNLTACGLESLSTRIRDLRDLVTLSNKSPARGPDHSSPQPTPSPLAELRHRGPPHLRLGDRSFSRIQSAPASAGFFERLNGSSSDATPGRGTLQPAPRIGHASPSSAAQPQSPSTPSTLGAGRRFTRSKTGVLTSPAPTPKDVGVFLGQNRLTSLPTALFEIRNLTVLTLRNNQLRVLPAAIGDLVHLKELNVSNNYIEYLPSTILDLTALETFICVNNNFKLPPDANDADGPSTSGRVLSPLRTFQDGPVAQLSQMCLTVLLSPRPPSNQPPFMDYDWDPQKVGGKHPLLDVEGTLRGILPQLGVEDLRRIVQAVQSAESSARVNRFPVSHKVPPPDDASTNVYYSPCPSPRHQEWDSETGEEGLLPRRVFLHPAEERFEWRQVCGEGPLPIRWLGCSPGCLEFLERGDEDEEDWPVEGLEEEP